MRPYGIPRDTVLCAQVEKMLTVLSTRGLVKKVENRNQKNNPVRRGLPTSAPRLASHPHCDSRKHSFFEHICAQTRAASASGLAPHPRRDSRHIRAGTQVWLLTNLEASTDITGGAWSPNTPTHPPIVPPTRTLASINTPLNAHVSALRLRPRPYHTGYRVARDTASDGLCGSLVSEGVWQVHRLSPGRRVH